MPLWLVDAGVPTDAALIGVTLAVFNLSAAAGGLVAGALSVRVERSLLVSATLVLAVVALLGVFATSPGSWPYFATVALAGALVHASFPVLIVAAQDLAPQASATASALLMGFASGAAGVLYIGIGRLQELLGLVPAMTVGYALAVPAALLALLVLRRWPTGGAGRAPSLASACACSPCPCAGCLPEVATAGAAR